MNVPSPRAYPRYSDIEAAIRRLPVLHEKLEEVRFRADYLATIGNIINEKGGDGTVPPNFRPAKAEKVKKDLSELEKRANDLASKIDRGGGMTRAREQLARLIRELPGPAITALSDATVLVDIWYFISELPKKLEEDEQITGRRNEVLGQKSRNRHSAAVQNAGRPSNKRAHSVANVLARRYFNPTGNQPTFSTVAGEEGEGTVYGPFLDFVREIFQVLNIGRDALSYAPTAAYKLRGSGRKK